MRVLVTGGAGFIGSAIVDQLVQDGHEVRVVDLLIPSAHRGKPDYLNPDADYHFCDLADPQAVRAAVTGIDGVSHQAAMVGLGVDMGDARDYVQHNDLATAVLLGALHERSFAGPIVLASSMTVYGEGRYRCRTHDEVRPGNRSPDSLARGEYEPPCPLCGEGLEPLPITEASAVDPRNVYAATKLHQEHLCAAYQREHGGNVVALRYHNVYGPRMPKDTPYAGVAAIFRSAAERGDTLQVYEDGAQRRDFIHVDDVARANVAALESEVGGTYNVATGKVHTILDLARAVAGEGPQPEVVGGGRIGDVRHVFGSPELARRELGFEAEVPFADGIRQFMTADLRA